MNHRLRRKSLKTWNHHLRRDNHLRRDESRLYVVYYVCLLYLFRHRSIYSFLIEVYLHLPSKYIFFRHRSITPIAEAVHYHVLKLLIHPLKKTSMLEGIASFGGMGKRNNVGFASDLLEAWEAIYSSLPKPLVIHYPQ